MTLKNVCGFSDFFLWDTSLNINGIAFMYSFEDLWIRINQKFNPNSCFKMTEIIHRTVIPP